MYVIDIHKIMYVCIYVYYERMRVVFIHIMHTREYYAYELVLASTRVRVVVYIILTIYFNMRTTLVASMHTKEFA